eukprot:CAMPEP_0170559708 /NCGR_PEP_ID=MMETSP0211-20121228/44587_1 /TAXON_ID=311385 /ORGANISM="Pseudokeronopsis sp., Strain OXSARD2" /LENGTH=90 /DNA_ID=CAMNT_0010873083 /DNA_START=353 /DNA_END=621 /DNA_ORIENTATION=+
MFNLFKLVVKVGWDKALGFKLHLSVEEPFCAKDQGEPFLNELVRFFLTDHIEDVFYDLSEGREELPSVVVLAGVRLHHALIDRVLVVGNL